MHFCRTIFRREEKARRLNGSRYWPNQGAFGEEMLARESDCFNLRITFAMHTFIRLPSRRFPRGKFLFYKGTPKLFFFYRGTNVIEERHRSFLDQFSVSSNIQNYLLSLFYYSNFLSVSRDEQSEFFKRYAREL